jgi:hypothetical protein
MLDLKTKTEIHGEAVAGRSATVRKAIEKLKYSLATNTFDMADLLAEAREKAYHHDWGFESFGDYATQTLGWSERQCYYLINIVTKSKKLEIDRESLKDIPMTKLKEVFSLDADTNADDLKVLLAGCRGKSLAEISKEVRRIKGIKVGEELSWRNFLVTESIKEVINAAIEKVRRLGGTTRDKDGNPVEISDALAINFICGDFLSAPDEVLAELLKEVSFVEAPGVPTEA